MGGTSHFINDWFSNWLTPNDHNFHNAVSAMLSRTLANLDGVTDHHMLIRRQWNENV